MATPSPTARTADAEDLTVPVLIVGAGAAGARAAIALAERGFDPLVVSQRARDDAHTVWAAGGINAALGSRDPEDGWAHHAADTLREGHLLNHPRAVERMAQEMPERIRELAAWGMPFARTESGRIEQRYFGAQSYRRTCFVGDRTGRALLATLVARAQQLGVTYRDSLTVARLLSDGERVCGAIGCDGRTGRFVLIRTPTIVLATGGYSALYSRHTSRDDENNGDGVALALQAGASLADMEFVQFHPTGMVGERYGAAWDGHLVTEAVRGEGGRLYNACGDRFMAAHAPQQMELAARDVVARAIAREIGAGRGTAQGGVHLDVSHCDAATLQARLPATYERFQSLGTDIATDPMEVAPTVHYSMGGICADPDTGATEVSGLYAIGEAAAGLHGANRLGGNSLAETVAAGQRVGAHLAQVLAQDASEATLPADLPSRFQQERQALEALTAAGPQATALLTELRALMEQHAGILRDGATLQAGLERLTELRQRWHRSVAANAGGAPALEPALNLQFGLTLAEAILQAAIARTESRGAHYRTDCPHLDPAQQANLTVRLAGERLALAWKPVPAPSPEVQAALARGTQLDYHLLE